MPTRMIRGAILDSDRFLNLSDNTARMCFLACLLRADDRGNMEGGWGHLVRLWRDFGIDSTEKAAVICQTLADQDLVRCYESGRKRFIHIPRFGQRMRSFKRACPPSPWCKNDEESITSSETWQQDAASGRGLSAEGKEEGRRDTKESSKGILAQTPWWKSDQGIQSMAHRMGIAARPGESKQEFKDRIFYAIGKKKAKQSES
jgi:hypothetical protein